MTWPNAWAAASLARRRVGRGCGTSGAASVLHRGVPKPLGPMQDFRSTLLHYDLADLGYQGYKYTWRNSRPENAFVEKGLDRAYANLKWREMFLAAKVRHLTASYSDHDPILLETVIA